MNLALIETPSRAATSHQNDPLELKSEAGPLQSATEFGKVMSDVLSPLKETGPAGSGQALADGTPMLSGFDAALVGDALKAIHLGPHLNVITAETTAPDEQSLEAFARSQGLDETAVQWLMGTAPSATTSLPSQLSAIMQPDSQTALNAAAGSLSSAVNSNPLDASPESVASTSVTSLASDPMKTGTAPKPLIAVVGTLSSAVNTNPLDAPHESVASTSVTSLASDPMKTGSALKPDVPVLNSGLNSAALWAMSLHTEKARIAATETEALSDAAKISIHLMPPPAPAAVWMLRNNLPPATAVPAAKEFLSVKSGMALSELDLTEAASPELLESLSQTMAEGGALAESGAAPSHLSGHGTHRHDIAAAARQEAQNAGASASTPDAGLAQRSENVQNLAEKMGQAVGQRILSEIEKGQWHLKLSLRPATLGHIEVEIRMRSGELDAVFTAPQAMTRELLQDGMSKLKDTLNQMGMDVASMQVGDGQTRQRGGESTPGKMSKSTNTEVDGSESAPISSVNAPPMKMGENGWDVLV